MEKQSGTESDLNLQRVVCWVLMVIAVNISGLWKLLLNIVLHMRTAPKRFQISPELHVLEGAVVVIQLLLFGLIYLNSVEWK